MSEIERVPFAQAFRDKTGGNQKVPKNAYELEGDIPVIDQSQNFIAGYTTPENQMTSVELPVIIFGDHTKAVKYIDFPFALGADGVKVLKVQDRFLPKYLYWILKDTQIPDAGYSRHFKFLKEKNFAKPSIEEQQKIVEQRDLQELIQQKRERQRELWAELEKSFFIDMFGNPFTNPKGLPMARLGDVAEILTGNSPSRADESNFGSDIEWIKSNNLGGRIATAAEEWLSESGKQKARIAPAGSVLVTCIAGSPESIGKCSLVDRDVAFNQQINAILPSENLSAEFILMQLKTFPELVRQKSSGGMKGLVSKSQFSEIEILNPDPILMKKFIDILQKEPGV